MNTGAKKIKIIEFKYYVRYTYRKKSTKHSKLQKTNLIVSYLKFPECNYICLKLI